MSKHAELIERLRNPQKNAFMPTRREAADALEAQERVIEAMERQVEILTGALAESRRKGDSFRVDAERYRLLREFDWIDSAVAEDRGIHDGKPEALDAAIDAAKGEPHGIPPTT